MIKWTKLDSGEYESKDERFHIERKYVRGEGNIWILTDTDIDDYFKSMFHEKTLLDCKMRAEDLLEGKM